jgi:hypothetical protein
MERSPQSLLALDEPVVILTHARSGSTLLRMILDAHPELACPAETSIVKICAHLAQAWQAMAPPRPADDPLPRAAAITIRAMVNSTFADYLLRTGKRRWCDKSLGTVRALQPFAELYPQTKYVCLYRHCMDVIDSALEASPFGLLGYGYENFISRFDGNSVAAVAAAWCEDTTLALDFEEANPEHCHRVYYEDLVESPEPVAAGLLSFLGAEPAAGITRACFAGQGDITGPGDHKVTVTSRVVTDSVGRGVRVPADLMPRGLLTMMNQLLDRLGYAAVDDGWRHSVPPPALFPGRAPAAVPPAAEPAAVPPAAGPAPDLLDQVAERISAQVGRRLSVPLPPAARGAVGPTRRIGVAVYGPGPCPVTRYWRLDLDRGRPTAERFVPVTSSPRVDWLVTGEARSWLSVLSGEKNVATSLRHRDLRCVDFGPADPAGLAASSRRSRSYPAIINHLLDLGESRTA